MVSSPWSNLWQAKSCPLKTHNPHLMWLMLEIEPLSDNCCKMRSELFTLKRDSDWIDKLVEQGRGTRHFPCVSTWKERVMQTEKETIIGKRALMRIKQTNPESAATWLQLSASRILTKGCLIHPVCDALWQQLEHVPSYISNNRTLCVFWGGSVHRQNCRYSQSLADITSLFLEIKMSSSFLPLGPQC